MDNTIELLKNWLVDSHISYNEVHPRVIEINQQNYLVLFHKQKKIFNPKMALIFDEDELNLLEDYKIDYFIFHFGDRFYYFGEDDCVSTTIYNEVMEAVGEELFVHSFYELRYIGNCVEQQVLFPHLGVHGGYDLCNGMRSYNDWCQKAKWVGISTLGICEENTLAGTLLFQNACEKAKINSIIGETIVVQYNSSLQYHIKLYVQNQQGWRNLCQINSIINTSIESSIKIEQLKLLSEGLICILTPTISLKNIYNQFKEIFDQLYYQLDFVEWTNAIKDEEWIEYLFEYMQEYHSILQPIALYDSYYLEKQEAEVQPILWRIGKRESFKYRSIDRYFKTCNEYLLQALSLFYEDSDAGLQMIDQAVFNAQSFEQIQFRIPTGEKHLPLYELTEEQQAQYQNSEDLFWALIDKGLQEKVIDKGLDPEIYLQRIQEEVRVIELGQVRDYFLIVWDILNFCKEREIITGIGRGSAAGCLVSYLLGIVQVDPIEYDLLFERFLNEGRMGTPTEIEYLLVDTDQGTIELDLQKTITILRDGEKIVILAKQLQSGDEIM